MSFLVSVLVYISALLLSYLLGSINFAIILSRLFGHDDVRRHGSGNAGTTNMIRTAGPLAGVLTLLGDFLKGAAAILIGRHLVFPWLCAHAPEAMLPFVQPQYGVYLCALACQLGHIFPVFFGFKGGKAVAVTLGLTMLIDWRVALIALGVFLLLFAIFRIVSLGSLAGAASLPVSTFLLAGSSGSRIPVTLLAALLGLVVILKHTENIGRLIRGEEKKLSFRKKS